MDSEQLELETGVLHCPACLMPFNNSDNLGVCKCADEVIIEAGKTKLNDLVKLQTKLVKQIQGSRD